MVEYLENVCIHRYAKMNHATEEVEETVEESAEEEEKIEEVVAEPADTSEDEQKKNEQEMRIRAILEEFLA